jgi:hypothetical protein
MFSWWSYRLFRAFTLSTSTRHYGIFLRNNKGVKMKKNLLLNVLLFATVLISLVGCNTAQRSAMKAGTDYSSVAVVSFAVNNYGAFGTTGAIDPALIDSTLPKILKKTEEILGQTLTVKPVASFVEDDAYRSLSIGTVKSGLYAPSINGTVLPSFSENRKDLVKGVLEPETAKELCRTLGVDAVVLVYSEWMIDSGKFIPTIKALTKNCFSMYSKDGTQVFYDRKDMRGTKVIGGAFAGVHINEGTIDQWIDAYGKSAEIVLKRNI